MKRPVYNNDGVGASNEQLRAQFKGKKSKNKQNSTLVGQKQQRVEQKKNEILKSYKITMKQVFLERIKKFNKPLTNSANKRKRFKQIKPQVKKSYYD